MKKTTIFLPEELASEIEIVSQQDCCSRAVIVRAALTEYLARRRGCRSRAAGLLAEGSVAGYDEECMAEHYGPYS